MPHVPHKAIPAADAAEIKNPVRLVAHLRDGQLLGLSYADYGVGICCQALFRAASDTAADNDRPFVAASVPDSYVAQVGDRAVITSGYEYPVARLPALRRRAQDDLLGETQVLGEHTRTDLALAHHVLCVRIPVHVAPELAYGERADAQARLRRGGDQQWGSVEVQPDGTHAYTVRCAYALRAPDHAAAQLLLSRPESRAVRSLFKRATDRRTARQFADVGLVLGTDAPDFTITLY